jgi:uncharacterized protein YjbJ (UPF0337 family)
LLTHIQSASSYECDGCSHHASFHSMENKTEDEVRKRWEQEAKDKADRDEETQQRPKKRVRAIEYQAATSSILGGNALGEALGFVTGNTKTAAKGRRAPAKTPGRAAAAKARSRVTETADDEEEEDEVIEVD